MLFCLSLGINRRNMLLYSLLLLVHSVLLGLTDDETIKLILTAYIQSGPSYNHVALKSILK